MEGLWRVADTISIRCFKNNLPSLARKSARFWEWWGFRNLLNGFIVAVIQFAPLFNDFLSF